MTSEILSDFSMPALILATKENLYAFFRLLGQSSQAEFQEAGGLALWHTPMGHPWFNGVLSSRPPGEDESASVAATLRYFQDRQVTQISWWLEPGLEMSDWAPHLEPPGFRAATDPPGMAAVLADLQPLGEQPAQLDIRRVTDRKSLQLWTDIFVAGYGLPLDWAGMMFTLLDSVGLDGNIRHYLGDWEGQPVAASSLFLGAGVAGIYDVATLPAARGKGIGSWLTLLPLQEAAGLGYQVGVLQSSEMGFNLYRRLGFQKVCDMEAFYWYQTTPEA